jgi:hypothetical protein
VDLHPDQFVYHHTPKVNSRSIDRWGLVPKGRAAQRHGGDSFHTGQTWFATEARPGPNTDIWKAKVGDIPNAEVFVDGSLDKPQTVVTTTDRVRKVTR